MDIYGVNMDPIFTTITRDEDTRDWVEYRNNSSFCWRFLVTFSKTF